MDLRDTPGGHSGDRLHVLVRPNRSLSPRGMAALFAGMAAVTVILGIGFSLAGAWPVLPFAGLEMAAVGAALYWLYRRADDHEQIIVDGDHVTVIQHRGGREQSAVFQRYWTRVTLEQCHRWYPSRLRLGSHGRFVVIGDDIGEDERNRLAARLNTALRRKAG